MTGEELVKIVKQRGYWRVLFEPLAYDEKLKPLRRCKEIVEQNSIRLRGWDYPHIPSRNDDDTALEPGDNYWQGWLNWQDYHHKEFWRMYQSGQFVHYFGLIEDWADDYVIKSMWQQEDIVAQPGEVLGIINATYFITEIYQFLSRLTSEQIYNEGVRVTIGLHNTENRRLFVDGYNRAPLFHERKTRAKEIIFKEKYTTEQILADPKELALEVIIYILERFGWDPPNIEAIKNDQQKLLERKI
jgi:hypothetical protein